MNRLRYTVILIAFALAAGCGPATPKPGVAAPAPAAAQTPKAKVVGAAMLTQTHVFYQDMVAAMEAEAAKAGIKLVVQYAEFDSRKQNDHLENFAAQGVDAIIVAPTDSSGMVPVIADARAKGIPVFTVDIAAHGADVVSHIASDNEKGGRLLGDYLAKRLGGAGNVAIIDHPIVASVQERTRGFEAAIAEHPGIKIVQRPPGEGQRDKALRAAQDILQANPDISAIFGINDDSALGALAAVESAGLQDKVIVLGFDGTPEAREAIKAGRALKADAVQFPDKIGAEAIRTVVRALAGEEVPKVTPVDVELIDAASLNAGS